MSYSSYSSQPSQDCRQAAPLMRAALDAGLTGEPPQPVRTHLANCESCRRFWAEESAIESGLRAFCTAADPEPPAGLHAGIMRALARQPILPRAARPGAFARFRKLGLAAAAILMLALVAGWPLLEPAPGLAPSSEDLVFPVALDGIFSALDPARILETPAKDFQNLAGSILGATQEWLPLQAEDPAQQ